MTDEEFKEKFEEIKEEIGEYKKQLDSKRHAKGLAVIY
jgi:hypothetical protein